MADLEGYRPMIDEAALAEVFGELNPPPGAGAVAGGGGAPVAAAGW
jgi:hypothetical protein